MTMSQLPGLGGLAELWEETVGDPSVCVAVLDGPVDRSHPSLAPARLGCLETTATCSAGDGPATCHGTHVASIIFGRHGGPVAGVAPGCRGLIVPIFSDAGRGPTLSCSQLELTRAILLAVRHGARIINISAGQFAPAGGAHPLLADAVRVCTSRGVLVVAAAGNDGCDCLHLPAALPNVLTVGAIGRSGRPLPFSNWGASYRPHGIMAPGEMIPGARPGGTTGTASGTSFATAIVSGVVALLMSLQVKHGRPADPLAVAAMLLETAIGCEPLDRSEGCQQLLAGRLNIPDAMSRVLGRGTSPTNLGAVDRPEVMDRPATSGRINPSTLLAPGNPDGGPLRPVYPLGRLSIEPDPGYRGGSVIGRFPARTADLITLLDDLDKNPSGSLAFLWTLQVDSAPVYALRPDGPFAAETHRRLRRFWREQVAGRVERIAVPGGIGGELTLSSGLTIPVIRPADPGMTGWAKTAIRDSIVGDAARFDRGSDAVSNFLDRVSEHLRNPGLTPRERALNFGLTHATVVERALATALRDGMGLDVIRVERSPFCRPESDCWDVELIFFDPKADRHATRRVFRVTVDVSDVVPVLIDGPRAWSIR
jgi:hypothetical protein